MNINEMVEFREPGGPVQCEQLWEVMRRYGSRMAIAADPPIETEIVITRYKESTR